ncbi:MAG: DUF3302 domain-containing protein [Pseudomonadota bacterium]
MGLGAFDNLDLYDYLTFLTLIILAIAFFSIAMFILGLPGKIAIERRHPHAEAVKTMGWMGFLAVVPWIHAFIWALHDGLTVDVRRGPKAQEKHTDEVIRKLSGEDPPAAEAAPETQPDENGKA